MSSDFNSNNQTMLALRRLNGKFDEQGTQMNDFMQRQAHGENPDPALFSKLLDQHSVTSAAMQAQFKLYEKPLKTVMNEMK